MSTIYTFHAETSTTDAIAAGDRFLMWDTSTGRTAYATGTALLAYAGSAPSLVSPAITGSPTYTGTSSVSFLIGSTLSSRIGFWGAAGTSAATTIAALTTTVTATGSGVGFQSTAAVASILSAINTLTSVLKDCGIVKT